jgi:hypothetical protein
MVQLFRLMSEELRIRLGSFAKYHTVYPNHMNRMHLEQPFYLPFAF